MKIQNTIKTQNINKKSAKFAINSENQKKNKKIILKYKIFR